MRKLLLVLALAACAPAERASPTPPAPASCTGDVELDALFAPEQTWSHGVADSLYFSPRVADLDGDGSSEVIVPYGMESPPSGGVTALDGASGDVRWEAPASQQLYGSPVFLDVTGDGVKDVFVGGRNVELIAVDGADGSLLWRFVPEGVVGSYNFYTAAWIPDQTGDDLPDLLVSNGGEDQATPADPRPPGHLLVLDSSTGEILAWAETPDGGETYMSPLVLGADQTGGETEVLFGTGGETWPGGLWRVALSNLLAGDLADAVPLVTTTAKGVIAPPARADFDRDGTLDVLVATFEGSLVLVDGRSDRELWRTEFEGTESYSTPTLGYFDADEVPDALVVFLRGQFPEYSAAVHAIVSGADGTIAWQEEIGTMSMGGGVAIDLNDDGVDEALFLAGDGGAELNEQEQLFLLDTLSGTSRAWGPPVGSMLPVSPWAGDLDSDGCADVLVPKLFVEGAGLRTMITRFRIAAPAPDTVSWSGYLGTEFDATLPSRP